MKIMFVCHGNICRSPMAEFVMERMLDDKGIKDVFVSSSATSTEEIWNGIGNPVYPPARRELEKHGISCDGKRAVQLKREDYEKYDLFVAMDQNNLRNIARIFGFDPENKVRKLNERDVSDPWYSGDFETCYQDIETGCKALLEEINSLPVEGKVAPKGDG